MPNACGHGVPWLSVYAFIARVELSKLPNMSDNINDAANLEYIANQYDEYKFMNIVEPLYMKRNIWATTRRHGSRF